MYWDLNGSSVSVEIQNVCGVYLFFLNDPAFSFRI